MVYGTARRVTGNANVAEDVSQDCFLRLAQNSSTIRGSLGAWLHRTSVNRALELRRSERARRLREAQATAQQNEDAPDHSTDLIKRVDEAMASLPEEIRVLVTEHYLCGRSQMELAAAMGLNQSTVCRRIEKGLQQLRERLKGDGDKDDARTMALAALPMTLEQFSKTSAPLTVRHALTKIGLSGVGGSVATASLSAVAWRFLLPLLGLAGALTGVALVLRSNPPVGPSAPATDASGVAAIASIEQVPAPVRRTFERLFPGATIREMERKPDGSRTVYDFDVTIDDKPCELRIAENGKLVWRRSN